MNFNRRDFLQIGAGAAALAVIPLKMPDLFLKPEVLKGLSSVRFVRCFDVVQMVMVNQFDALWGPLGIHLEQPRAVEASAVLHASKQKPLTGFDVREWLQDQCTIWIPPGYNELLTETLSSSIQGKNGIVHRTWIVKEKWATQVIRND